MRPYARVAHGRVSLALHELRAGDETGRLLLLHALGASAGDWKGFAAWPGSGAVHALDFSGHGASDARPGGAYTPELLAADADAALAALGPCCVVGAGLGAYVALLVAGARPELAPGALLLPGEGVAGSGDAPGEDALLGFADDLVRFGAGRPDPAACDPAVVTCARDVRPPDYARAFALAARRLVLVEDGATPPGWWQAVRDVPAARTAASLEEGLALVLATT